MNTNRLQKLAGIPLNEADTRTLRRVVILAIFTSNIPNEMEVAFKRRISSNPDSDVIRANKKFLEQVLEDKALLMNDPNYQELKQDPEFLRLSKSVVDALTSLNKAGDLDFGNIAYAKPILGRNKLSYSTVLYVAAENEVKNLEQYLTREYGDGFVFKLLRTKEMGTKTINDPTTPAEPLDELNQPTLQNMLQSGYLPSKEFDKKFGTHLAKEYRLPIDKGIIQKHINSAIGNPSLFNDNTYSEETDQIYNALIGGNSDLKKIRVRNVEDKWNVIYGVLSHFNADDIKYFVENEPNRFKDEIEKTLPVERAYDKHDVAIDWIPSPKSWEIIKNVLTTKFPDVRWPLTDINEEIKGFFKLIM